MIRPRNTQFYYKAKSDEQVEKEPRAYERAASQGKIFDKQLAALKPSPFEFRFKFEDGAGDARLRERPLMVWMPHR